MMKRLKLLVLVLLPLVIIFSGWYILPDNGTLGDTGIVAATKGGKTLSTNQLRPTHKLTRSKQKMAELIQSIKTEGIQKPIKYVEVNGTNYVVNGHHRLRAARQLGITEVPVEQVNLPYKGYKTIQDLFWGN